MRESYHRREKSLRPEIRQPGRRPRFRLDAALHTNVCARRVRLLEKTQPMKPEKPLCAYCSDQSATEHPVFDLCRANRFHEALAICQREITADPNEPAGYSHAAYVLERMNRHADARHFRDKVVELSPNPMTYYSRADLLYEMGEYAAAIPDFTRSAELDHEQAIGAVNFLYRADCHR